MYVHRYINMYIYIYVIVTHADVHITAVTDVYIRDRG